MPEETGSKMCTKWVSDYCLSALYIAELEMFPTAALIELNPIIGDSLRIGCAPPKVYPRGSIYFGYSVQNSNILEHLVNDKRVLLDYEGTSCTEVRQGETRYVHALMNEYKFRACIIISQYIASHYITRLYVKLRRIAVRREGYCNVSMVLSWSASGCMSDQPTNYYT